MSSSEDVQGTLAEIATHPSDEWKQRLERSFPARPAMVQQALLWLRADQDKLEDESAPPSLGRLGDERYELVVRLASGTTASVWKARDRKLGRNVAIKVFHTSSDDAALELMEARAACDVVSDYVVRILDVYDSGERPYIVMELVAEQDAERDELAIGASASSCRPASAEEAARWVLFVARGVRDAHLRNVFHRDLKPHNVMITPISRQARIADFGLALSAATGQRRRTSALVTRGPSGPVSIVGTPEYMAPEQARGLPLHLDPLTLEDRLTLIAVDIWGLGALAYDLLSGNPPWQGEDEPWEVAASGRTPRPLHDTPGGVTIPSSLRRIVEKAMMLDPKQRYSSAAQLAHELEAYLASRPTSLDHSHLARAALWSKRNPQLTVTGAVALVLAAMTLAVYASVVKLRDQRQALTAEVSQQRIEEGQVKARAATTRAELDKTEAQLKTEGLQLAQLEKSLADEQKLYTELLAAKEKALVDANAATRSLVGQLGTVREERRTAEDAQKQFEGLWKTARSDADSAAKARDQARVDRDAARVERDGLKQERDALAGERDQARSERDLGAQEIARLSAALAGANATLATRPPVSSLSDAGAGSSAPPDAASVSSTQSTNLLPAR